ncbi:glycosyltransferase [Vibrio splendidus]|uniref:glycosyltransferase n=1 Tax=Vibrio splendidus TaxID=29497 RepID=UPI000D39D72B|nr:glycosyltransferase [Vibrio splendidus]PTO65219.1 hypothetical protein CWN99_08840 [Vibrio splendidus]
MKRILIISDICLSNDYVAGNKNALLSLVDYLCSHPGIEIDFLNFHHKKPDSNFPENCRILHYPDIFNLTVRKLLGFLGWQKGLLKYKKSIFRKLTTCCVSRFNEYDLVFIEYLENYHLINCFSSNKTKKICDIHDVMTLRKKSFSTQGKLPKLENLDIELDDEISTLNQFDVIMAIEESEAVFLSSRVSHADVILCKRTLFPNVEISSRSISSPRELVLGFIGSRAEFNQDVFFNHILPIWNNCLSGLGFKLVIAGAISEIIMSNLDDIHGDIKILGKLDDLKEFYEQIDVSLNPIWAGSGFKTKNAEALSYGKPVITTALGAMGFEGVSEKYMMRISDSNHESWLLTLSHLFDEYIKDENYNLKCHSEFKKNFGIKKNYTQLEKYIS